MVSDLTYRNPKKKHSKEHVGTFFAHPKSTALDPSLRRCSLRYHHRSRSAPEYDILHSPLSSAQGVDSTIYKKSDSQSTGLVMKVRGTLLTIDLWRLGGR
jgi:hypothetical protein